MEREGTRGFTIVELLIVLVVIGILAAITGVTYNGIQNRARSASIQADVSNAFKQIQTFATVNNDAYPADISACPTPASDSLCLKTSDTNSQSYYVDNGAVLKSFCYTVGDDAISYYVDHAGQTKQGDCSQQSCYAIQQSGGSHGSGVYWVQPPGSSTPFRAYCDMDTSGGGWTLIVTNPGPASSWNTTKILSVNPNNPSISEQYSVLNKANDIKANLNGKLRYRIDATGFGRLGGVWEAPYSSSFVASSNPVTATNIEQYDVGSWTIDTDTSNGTGSPSNLMPYIMDSTRILTTTTSTSSWWGTLVSNSGSFSPAPWIGNPGIIWYWVR